MYLVKNALSNYYTRIALPKSLRDLGFPFSVRVSLETKSRKVAIDRNLKMAAHLRHLIDTLATSVSAHTFQKWILDAATQFRANAYCDIPSPQIVAPSITDETQTSGKALQPPQLSTGVRLAQSMTFDAALERFLASKQSEKIQQKSIGLLRLRISAFVKWAKKKKFTHVDQIEPRHAMDYRDQLLTTTFSSKTKTLYLSAIKQFFSWCTTLQFCLVHPFQNIKFPHKKNVKKDENRRCRWKQSEAKKLFDYLMGRFRATDRPLKIQDYWVPLICLYMGLRPSEACQLSSKNVIEMNGIWVLNVDKADEESTLKTENAYRVVPIHQALLDHGFLEFVEQGKNRKQLFDDKPFGPDHDWSNNLVRRYTRHLTRAGFLGNPRPTVYGFRHTFIDELQQAQIPENIVSELVGHAKPGFTYSHYGKNINAPLLQSTVNTFPYDFLDWSKLDSHR